MNDDSVSVRSLGSQSTILKKMPGKIDPVAALAPQRTGRLYCCGTERGLIEIFDAGRGHVAELRRSTSRYFLVGHAGSLRLSSRWK